MSRKHHVKVTDDPASECAGCGAQSIDPGDRFHQADSNESYPCCRGDRASWLAELNPPTTITVDGKLFTCEGDGCGSQRFVRLADGRTIGPDGAQMQVERYQCIGDRCGLTYEAD